MSNYNSLKATINANIKQNGNQEITGPVLNSVLTSIVNSLGAGYQYIGVADSSTNPGTPDQNVAYLAGPGPYPYFGGLVVPERYLGVLKFNGTWAMDLIEGVGSGAAILRYVAVASIADLPDPGVDGTGYLVGQNLYLYVGEGGDTLDGKYQDCGAFRGPQGPPTEGNGEDIDTDSQGKMQFANRPYNTLTPNGLGYKILRKDATFASQVTEANTIYEIRYDFDLGGASFTIPSGSVLAFNGGTISNGILSGQFNVVSPGVCFKAIDFVSAIMDGVSLAWFDVKENVPCGDIFNAVFSIKSREINIPAYAFPLLVEAPTSVSELGIYSCIRVKEGDKVIDFNNNTIKLQATSNGGCKVLSIECDNATIKNLNIIGDVSTHTGSTGEVAHGVSLIVCSNIRLENINISECWGDGICFVDVEQNGVGYYPHDIQVVNCKSYRNRRNAMSIEAGRRLEIVGCEFAYTGSILGTSPSAGLDIEPYHDVEVAKVEDVMFAGCSFHDNAGQREVLLSENAQFVNATIDKITFNDCNIYHATTSNATSLMYALNIGALNITGGTFGTAERNGVVDIKADSLTVSKALINGELYVEAQTAKISSSNIVLCDSRTTARNKALYLTLVGAATFIDCKIIALVKTCMGVSKSSVDFEGCTIYDANTSVADADRMLFYASAVSMKSCSLRLGSAISLNAFANENHHFSLADSKWEKMSLGASPMFINNLKSHIASFTYDVEIKNTRLVCNSGQVFMRGSDSNDVKIYIERFPEDASILTYEEYRLLPTNDVDGKFPVIGAGTIVMRDSVKNHLTQYEVGFRFFDKTLNLPLVWNGSYFIGADGTIYNTQKTTISGWTSAKVIYCNQGVGNAYDTNPKGLQGARYVIIPVTPGNVYVINGEGGSSPRLWCFADANNKILSVAETYAKAHNDYLALVPPAGATQLIINNYSGYTEDCYELIP